MPVDESDVLDLPGGRVLIKIEYEYLAQNDPYQEIEKQLFSDYLKRISDLLIYDKKQSLSHGVLARRILSQEGIIIYRNPAKYLIIRKIQDIGKMGLAQGKGDLPMKFLLPENRCGRGKNRKRENER